MMAQAYMDGPPFTTLITQPKLTEPISYPSRCFRNESMGGIRLLAVLGFGTFGVVWKMTELSSL
jgi:hypothetical protein